jgi:hypothetical protein
MTRELFENIEFLSNINLTEKENTQHSGLTCKKLIEIINRILTFSADADQTLSAQLTLLIAKCSIAFEHFLHFSPTSFIPYISLLEPPPSLNQISRHFFERVLIPLIQQLHPFDSSKVCEISTKINQSSLLFLDENFPQKLVNDTSKFVINIIVLSEFADVHATYDFLSKCIEINDQKIFRKLTNVLSRLNIHVIAKMFDRILQKSDQASRDVIIDLLMAIYLKNNNSLHVFTILPGFTTELIEEPEKRLKESVIEKSQKRALRTIFMKIETSL